MYVLQNARTGIKWSNKYLFSILDNLDLLLLQKCFSKFLGGGYFPWSNLTGKSENTLETHTFDFKTLEKTKPFSALLWVKKASTAGQEQHTHINHQELTALLHPNPNLSQSKHMEEWKGKGERERSCQRLAHAPTASTLWRRLCILHKWHYWGKISQESASLTCLGAFKVCNDLPTKIPQ